MDRAALRERYRAERDKRIRPDGNAQYLEPSGRFANLLDDPYVERVGRAPQERAVEDVLNGGAGDDLCVSGSAANRNCER